MTANGNGFPSTQKPAATFCDNNQSYDSFKGLALIKDILSRACGRVFRDTTIEMDFISDKSFNKVVKRQTEDNYCFNYRLKQLRAKNSSTRPQKYISY